MPSKDINANLANFKGKMYGWNNKNNMVTAIQNALHGHELPVSCRQLCDELGFNREPTHRVLQRLIHKGLVTRTRVMLPCKNLRNVSERLIWVYEILPD